jgi:UDP-glucose 4-epimerase
LALQDLDRRAGFLACNLGNGAGLFGSRGHRHRAQRERPRNPGGDRRAQARGGDPPRLVGDASRAIRELGRQPRYADLATIIETAWRWLNRNAQGFDR